MSDERPVGEQAMPLPSDLRSVFQGGLFVLALLAALYAAQEIVLPVVLAFMLNLPLERLRVPRMLGALLLIGLVFCTIVGFGTAMSGPTASWAAKLPEGVPPLQRSRRSFATGSGCWQPSATFSRDSRSN